MTLFPRAGTTARSGGYDAREFGHATITTTARYPDRTGPRAVIETMLTRTWTETYAPPSARLLAGRAGVERAVARPWLERMGQSAKSVQQEDNVGDAHQEIQEAWFDVGAHLRRMPWQKTERGDCGKDVGWNVHAAVRWPPA